MTSPGRWENAPSPAKPIPTGEKFMAALRETPDGL